MAGYVITQGSQAIDGSWEFHIGDSEIAYKIRKVTDHKRVITLQLDGDELDAALWGLANFQKGAKVDIHHARACPCPIEDCWARPHLTKNGV